jgi:hypothetical protein
VRGGCLNAERTLLQLISIAAAYSIFAGVCCNTMFIRTAEQFDNHELMLDYCRKRIIFTF